MIEELSLPYRLDWRSSRCLPMRARTRAQDPEVVHAQRSTFSAWGQEDSGAKILALVVGGPSRVNPQAHDGCTRDLRPSPS